MGHEGVTVGLAVADRWVSNLEEASANIFSMSRTTATVSRRKAVCGALCLVYFPCVRDWHNLVPGASKLPSKTVAEVLHSEVVPTSAGVQDGLNGPRYRGTDNEAGNHNNEVQMQYGTSPG